MHECMSEWSCVPECMRHSHPPTHTLFSPYLTGQVRLANHPTDYLIVSHFRGSKEDTGLQIGGELWCKLVTRIRESNCESLGDLQPRKKKAN